MNYIELIDFSELLLVGDMRYLRFIEKNSNKLYLVEYYTPVPLEETVENLNRLKTMEDVKNYFKDAYIFEFIEARDLKKHLNTIKEMSTDEKKMLTEIVKEIKQLNIRYINFENFFVETQDRKLYYAKLSNKTGNVKIKNLKIEFTIKPADIDNIIRDIKAYGAFKYHNMTIKYDDIKEYIDNYLVNPKEELSWVVKKIREYDSNKRIKEKVKEENNVNNKKNEAAKIDETKKQVNLETKKIDDLKPLIDNKSKEYKKIKKNDSDTKFKGSLMMYCMIGFTAGVLLAAITIVIGSFI